MKRIYKIGWAIAIAAAIIHIGIVAFVGIQIGTVQGVATSLGLVIPIIVTLAIFRLIYQYLPGLWKVAPTGLAIYASVGYLAVDLMSILG